MNDMSGNPYAEAHQHRPGVTEDDEQWAIAQATLALAFEQRTASLVALYTAGPKFDSLHEQIKARLGLNGDTK